LTSKPWYESKTIWAGILTLAVAIWNTLPVFGVVLPAIPEAVYAILAAFGIYGRTTATTTIK
jgi:hypothetical protein